MVLLDMSDNHLSCDKPLIQIAALSDNTSAMSDKQSNSPDTASPPKLLDQVRERIRLKHYSIRTEQAYVHWVKRYIIFHGKRHPAEMGKVEIEAFLTSLAVERNVSASTQTQALSALLFLYKIKGVRLTIKFPI